MNIRALCFRCAALLIMLTTSFKSVSCDLPHLQNSHSGPREKLAAIAMQPTTKTSPTVVRNMPTSASKLMRENASSHRMTPVLTMTIGTTKSVSLLKGAPPATEHACPELRFHAGSFAGGVVLTLAVMLTVFLGYKLALSRQKVQYRAIKEEHEAII
ncbi:hypothetical protein GJAV_G00058260 [Gymnothorax javanicus]|nr:hypothetical protein GJAV_G00058260 [Gymnothorax javanicus]